MIYRQGPVTRYSDGDFAEESGLYTFATDTWVADIGLSHNMVSYAVINVEGECGVPQELLGYFHNKASLETALTRYLTRRAAGVLTS